MATARSPASVAFAMTLSAALVCSWRLTSIASTAANAASPTCSPRRARLHPLLRLARARNKSFIAVAENCQMDSRRRLLRICLSAELS
eukprot:6213778-Pleurochrysis_carterae.AAC.2